MDITRITSSVAQIRLALLRQCGLVTMAIMILNEDGAEPAADGVRRQLGEMAEACRRACDRYNKLRAVTGEMEAALGVKNPTFYVKDYIEAGEPVCANGKCTCGRLTLGDTDGVINT